MEIYNDRKMSDIAGLSRTYWQNIEYGIDGYPVRGEYGGYCIAGCQDSKFKATAIEIYGVK